MNSSTTAARRLRAKCACIPCSTRKRKCNGTYPCNTCRRYGYHCGYRHNHAPWRRIEDTEEPHLTNSLVEPRQHRHEQQQQQRTTPNASQTQPRSSPPLQQQPAHEGTSEMVQESNNGYLITPSSRYLGRHSLETFPRYLALHLQAETLPQLQPFLWNLQIRQMPHCAIRVSLCSLITLSMAIRHVSATFATEFPVCGFLDLETLIARCQKHWAGINQGLAFEALIAGIIGLAAVLTPVTPQLEVDIVVRHAETILTDQAILTEPNIEVLAAVIFRVLYLRATATPHVTWLLSCTAMHMIESLGLHKDYSNQYDATYGPDTVACLFWIICAGNRVLSHELGRSPVLLQGVTRKFPFPISDKSPTASLARLGRILPLTDDEAGSDNDVKRLTELFDTVENHTGDHTFLKLYAADVCFCLYRRICVNNKVSLISRRESQQIMSVGRAAVHAVNLLVQRGQPWWNMLSTLFQFACVLISMDSPDSLGDLSYTIQTINLVRDCYPGTKVSQALSALKILIHASKQRKEQEVTLLSVVEELDTKPGGDIAGGSVTMPLESAFPELAFDFREWGTDDLEWATYNGFLPDNSTM